MDKNINSTEKILYTEEGLPIVTPSVVREVVGLWTGIPLQKLNQSQAEAFLNLEERIGNFIIGQNHAVRVISNSLRRYASGMRNPKRPIGSFFFSGPTGVGKTQLTKLLADKIFGSSKSLIRLDMSEYMDSYTVSRLIGSPPGYVGFDDGGQLTDAIRSQPYSVVLFDEIEKAHPDVCNLLLQILDDGVLSDMSGRIVSFQTAIIILTSNLGALSVLDFCTKNPIRSPKDEDDLKEIVIEQLKVVFRPEFINRLDDVIVFHPLSRGDILCIAHLLFLEIDKRLAVKGIHLLLSSRILETIADEGYMPEYGARPLRRAVSKWIEDPISYKLLEENIENINPGSVMVIDTVKSEYKKESIALLLPYREMIVESYHKHLAQKKKDNDPSHDSNSSDENEDAKRLE